MRSGRLSFFAAAAWLVPLFVFLMMMPYVEAAAARDTPNWALPRGFGAFLVQLGVTAGSAFILGLVSFLRGERLWWFATIPAVPGGLFAGWLVLVSLRNRDLSSIRAIQRSPDLTAGILAMLIGVFFLAYLLPKASSLLAREKEADDLGETGTEMKVKAFKVVGIAALLVGVALILVHLLDIF